eukprot:10866092-Alexandrium_andersonii.AAC.1
MSIVYRPWLLYPTIVSTLALFVTSAIREPLLALLLCSPSVLVVHSAMPQALSLARQLLPLLLGME